MQSVVKLLVHVKYASFLCPPLRFAVDIASQQGPAYQAEANPSARPFPHEVGFPTGPDSLSRCNRGFLYVFDLAPCVEPTERQACQGDATIALFRPSPVDSRAARRSPCAEYAY